MISACVRSTACLASLKTSCGLLRITAVGNFDIHSLNRSGARPGLSLVPSECPVLKCDEPRSIAGEAHICRQLALEHLPREYQLAALVLESNAVADHGASHSGCQLGHKIAHLISVRHQHEFRLTWIRGIASVPPQTRQAYKVRASADSMCVNFRDFLPRNLGSNRAHAAAHDSSLKPPPSGRGDRLSGSNGFPRNPIQLPFALLHHYENRIWHKFSLLSLLLATMLGTAAFGCPARAQARRLHLKHPQLIPQLIHQLLRDLSRRPVNVLRLLGFLRHIQLLDLLQIVAERRLYLASGTFRRGLFFACLIPISVA